MSSLPSNPSASDPEDEHELDYDDESMPSSADDMLDLVPISKVLDELQDTLSLIHI